MTKVNRQDIRQSVKSGNIDWSDVISSNRGIIKPYEEVSDEFVKRVMEKAGLAEEVNTAIDTTIAAEPVTKKKPIAPKVVKKAAEQTKNY